MDPCFYKKRKLDVILEKDDEEKDKEITNKKKKEPWIGLADSPSLETYRNHIYFYCSVSKKHV